MGGFGQRGRVQVDGGHPGAAPDRLEGDRTADPAAGAGYHKCLARDLHYTAPADGGARGGGTRPDALPVSITLSPGEGVREGLSARNSP
ncbi:hypothetical protein Apa02nite_022330 [Actinoplanes palleronii]|uniref:Uncharacterized protein n=1 Tax=Actinoplanes palleronii TaxID=113570 RepID=A0ABQ4B640_9ACTN|nr:hypothetical protein Apa02nite_022330 [Actinoplanes palleronii]